MDISNRKQVWASWTESAATDKNAALLVNNYVKRPPIEFYDLKKDPWELKNLAGKKKYSNRIMVMRQELERWMNKQGDYGAEMDMEL